MGAGKGNKNALGHTGGSGRKSAYQEMADAKTLNEIFFQPQNLSELKRRIDAGRYALKDIFIYKTFAGNDKMLLRIFDKVFPDNMFREQTPPEDQILSATAERLAAKYINKNPVD
jgi:hypothetical protein